MSTHLRIVAFNDVYVLDHLPRMATLVREARAGADRLLVTLAGDFLAPSTLSSLDDGRGMVACLNAVGVTHVTFGNHEDDVPHAALVARVGELEAVWLATNVHDFNRPLPARDVITIGAGGEAIRVGVLGVCLADPLVFRGRPFHATLEPPNPAAVREARSLVADGCAWVIALTHQAADDDRALARALAGVPAIVIGGHEHVALDETIAGIRVVKAGVDATHAVIIDAVFSGHGDAASPVVTTRLESVAGHAEDPALRALVDRCLVPVDALATATLVEVPAGRPLSSVGARARQTSVGEMVCSRIRDVLHADACVFNAGGVRGARDYPARFTYGDLEAEVPFDNEVVLVAMPGRVLADAIRASRADAPAERGAYLQVDDRLAVDATGAVTRVANAPFNPARSYRVALVRDLCFGLDHIEPLVAFAQSTPDAIPPAGGLRTAKELLVRSFAGTLWAQLGGFAAVDANHDGRVDAGELTAALERTRPGQGSAIIGGLLVRALDANHDDAVEAAEEPEPQLGASPPRSTAGN